jgi:pentatricopeptide repeat protein
VCSSSRYHNRHGLEITRSNGHGWYLPAVVGYNAALSAAARAGDYITALQLFDTMLDESQNQRLSDQVTAGTVLAAC